MNASVPAIAVLSLAIAGALRFEKNEDGTVTDKLLNLQWSPTLSEECVTHAQAEKIAADCRLGGHTDWRLPTEEELFLLADRSRYSPAIDTEYFADTQSDWYWSSSIYAPGPAYAWFVGFVNGSANCLRRGSSSAFVRAVRSVAPGQ